MTIASVSAEQAALLDRPSDEDFDDVTADEARELGSRMDDADRGEELVSLEDVLVALHRA